MTSDSDIYYSSLDTPAILVDLEKLDSNISQMAEMTAKSGLKLRPNTKVHKSSYIADLQIKSGAIGLCVSKPSEAAAFAAAGFTNIMIAHPFVGPHKLELLASLAGKIQISCVVDSVYGAQAIAGVGKLLDTDIPVLLKINSNCNRFGVMPGQPAIDLADILIQIQGIRLVGILTHESSSSLSSPSDIQTLAYETAFQMNSTAKSLKTNGIELTDVILGSTPTARDLCRYAEEFPEITEIHPGAYVFGDVMYMNALSTRESSCAATVLSTVVSIPNENRACIDGGYKTFGADPLLFLSERTGMKPRFGIVKGRPELEITRLTEEIGILSLNNPNVKLGIGDRIEVIPNHVSLSVNLHDKMYGVRNGELELEIPVTCRGMDT